jgi:hypothetical protein
LWPSSKTDPGSGFEVSAGESGASTVRSTTRSATRLTAARGASAGAGAAATRGTTAPGAPSKSGRREISS